MKPVVEQIERPSGPAGKYFRIRYGAPPDPIIQQRRVKMEPNKHETFQHSVSSPFQANNQKALHRMNFYSTQTNVQHRNIVNPFLSSKYNPSLYQSLRHHGARNSVIPNDGRPTLFQHDIETHQNLIREAFQNRAHVPARQIFNATLQRYGSQQYRAQLPIMESKGK